MKSIRLLATAVYAAVAVMGQTGTTPTKATATASKGVQKPSAPPQLNVITVQGCFSDPGELKFNSTPEWNSESSCVQEICFKGGYEVAGTTGGNQCFCGKKYPPKSAKVEDNKCNIGCAGFDLQACGGFGTWTIYNTGKSVVVDTAGEESINRGGANGAQTTIVQTTVVAPVPATDAAVAPQGKSGPNVGAIAGGVVVGVLAIAGVIGGMFFYMRRKRNKEIEEEHQRHAAVNSFISGKSSSGGSITDARLDPVMAQRRMSDGSIADNHDYSRKILRVTNA